MKQQRDVCCFVCGEHGFLHDQVDVVAGVWADGGGDSLPGLTADSLLVLPLSSLTLSVRQRNAAEPPMTAAAEAKLPRRIGSGMTCVDPNLAGIRAAMFRCSLRM